MVRPPLKSSGCESDADLGFTSGLAHGVTTSGPVKGWKSQRRFPARNSSISSRRNTAGIRWWIGDISGEAAVVTIE